MVGVTSDRPCPSPANLRGRAGPTARCERYHDARGVPSLVRPGGSSSCSPAGARSGSRGTSPPPGPARVKWIDRGGSGGHAATFGQGAAARHQVARAVMAWRATPLAPVGPPPRPKGRSYSVSVWHQSTTIGTNQRPYCNVRFPQCVRNKCFFLLSDTCARPLCTLANTNRRTRPKHFTDQWTQQLTSFPTVKVWPRLKHLTGRTRSRRAAAHPEKKAPQIKYPRQFRACRPL